MRRISNKSAAIADAMSGRRPKKIVVSLIVNDVQRQLVHSAMGNRLLCAHNDDAGMAEGRLEP